MGHLLFGRFGALLWLCAVDSSWNVPNSSQAAMEGETSVEQCFGGRAVGFDNGV